MHSARNDCSVKMGRGRSLPLLAGERHRAARFFIAALLVAWLVTPAILSAATVTGFAFTSSAQFSVSQRDKVTVQAQDSSGASASIPQTGCLEFKTSSPTGAFFENQTAADAFPALVVTMNKGTANRTVYYRDTATGSVMISLRAALRPESEDRSCKNWPSAEWGEGFSAAQAITVGGGSSSSAPASTAAAGTAPSSSPAGGASFSPEPSIAARAIVPHKGIVGAAALFLGEAKGLKGEPLQNARFRWSFGDGGSAEGQKVSHTYHYPGRYAVFLDVSSGEWGSTARGEISVTPAELRISRVISGDGGFIEIANDGAEEINLSLWRLQSGVDFFLIPQNTVLLPNQTVPFPSSVTKLSLGTDNAALLYPNGAVAARYEKKQEVLPEVVQPVQPVLAPPQVILRQEKLLAPPVVPHREQALPRAQTGIKEPAATSSLAAAPAAAPLFEGVREEGGAYKWFSGVLALLLVGVAGFAFFNRVPAAPETAEAKKREKETGAYDLIE